MAGFALAKQYWVHTKVGRSSDASFDHKFQRSRNHTASARAKIFTQVPNLERVGIQDNFMHWAAIR
jgi:hypothetical protein